MRPAPAPLAALAAVAALLAAPAAEACSLADVPFGQPRFEGDTGTTLWYVSISGLHRVVGAQETLVTSGYFLGHAHADGAVLVAGQAGLGAGCEGTPWLELRDARDPSNVLWRRQAEETRPEDLGSREDARVFPHPMGPFAAFEGKLWRLEAGDLEPLGTPMPERGVWGWTHDGKPVSVRDDGDVQAGDLVVPLEGYLYAVAAGPDTTGLMEAIQAGDGGRLVLHTVAGGSDATVAWDVGPGWPPVLAAAGDAWLVAAGGRAYRVADGAATDLGVANATAVATRAGSPVVFTEDGYVVLDKTGRAEESWRRVREPGHATVWLPSSAQTQPRPVSATTGAATGLATAPPDAGVPGFPLALAVGALVAAAWRRPRQT